MFRILIVVLILVPCLAMAQDDRAAQGRFAQENALLGPPGPDEMRVVFLGDSITEGWSDASPDFFADRGYVERGISGQTTPQMLTRFRADVVNLEPKAVVILAGTNDIAGNSGPATNQMIEDNLASMAEIAAANDIRVILASILPAYDYPWNPGLQPAGRIAAINAWLRNYAEDNDHIYLDYYSALVDDRGGMQERYTTDGVHVTAEGYAVMEELAELAIDEALERPRREPGRVGFRPIDGCAPTAGHRRASSCN